MDLLLFPQQNVLRLDVCVAETSRRWRRASHQLGAVIKCRWASYVVNAHRA